LPLRKRNSINNSEVVKKVRAVVEQLFHTFVYKVTPDIRVQLKEHFGGNFCSRFSNGIRLKEKTEKNISCIIIL